MYPTPKKNKGYIHGIFSNPFWIPIISEHLFNEHCIHKKYQIRSRFLMPIYAIML